MSKITDSQYLRSEQYSTCSNLEARIALHARFSLNPQGWQRWVFEQIDLPSGCCILELGCGSGILWQKNLDRLSPAGKIILSDFSAGMVAQAQKNLAEWTAARFQIIDAQAIPYAMESFDRVIGNHMLYHLPDRGRALAEIRRVLESGGWFYCATGGERHMAELYELVQNFDLEVAANGWYVEPIDFTLESGHAQLSAWFGRVERRLYIDSLVVTEVEPLVDYILSTVRLNPGVERRADLRRYIQAEMARNGGAIRITKDGGLFIAGD